MLILVGMDEGKNDMWIGNFFSRIHYGNKWVPCFGMIIG